MMPRDQSAIAEVDAIAREGVAVAEAVADSTLLRLLARLARRGWDALRANPASAESDIEVAIAENMAAVERALIDHLIASWLGGADSVLDEVPLAGRITDAVIDLLGVQDPVTRRLLEKGGRAIAAGLFAPAKPAAPPQPPPPVDPVGLIYPGDEGPLVRFPFLDAAVENLISREVVPPDRFRRLFDDARQQAFTITSDLAVDAIRQVRDMLVENVREATDREGFEREFRRSFGSSSISPAHLEQVFRNNVNAGYSDGAEEVLRQRVVSDAFPYRAYFAIRDERAEDTHLAMETRGLDGTNVYHKDDPVWQMFRPPWRWNCRCGWSAYTVRQAARAGVKEARTWLETGEPPTVHQRVEMPPWRPPEGWQRPATFGAVAA